MMTGTYLNYDININHSDSPSTPGREQRSNRQILSMGGGELPSEYENYADIYGGYDSSNPNSPNRS